MLVHYLIIKNWKRKMNDNITKDDLRQFGLLLVEQFKQIIENNQQQSIPFKKIFYCEH
jgi:hypothetical protein